MNLRHLVWQGLLIWLLCGVLDTSTLVRDSIGPIPSLTNGMCGRSTVQDAATWHAPDRFVDAIDDDSDVDSDDDDHNKLPSDLSIYDAMTNGNNFRSADAFYVVSRKILGAIAASSPPRAPPFQSRIEHAGATCDFVAVQNLVVFVLSWWQNVFKHHGTMNTTIFFERQCDEATNVPKNVSKVSATL